MIHFFPTFSADAAASPLGQALRDGGVPHRIFAGFVNMSYRSRWQLAFICLPNLAWFALRSAVASLLRSRPAPDAVVLGSDVEVLVFALVRFLTWRRQVRIVLGSFILTQRSDPRVNRLRHLWFGWLLRRTDLVIVHSRLEVDTYQRLFPARVTRFVFVPWGTTIAIRDRLLREEGSPFVVSAGRSGRDYATLTQAVRGTDIALRIVCDYAHALKGIVPEANVTLLTSCHSVAYFQQLYNATLVVIPLAIEDISAGQMVLVQAKGLGKPVIVTDSPTVRDYVTHGEDAVLVPRGDAAAMRAAMLALLGDPAECARLGANARRSFEDGFTTEQAVRRLVAAIETHLRPDRQAASAGC